MRVLVLVKATADSEEAFSTTGGLGSLQRFWRNVVSLKRE
jgi:hypothetical protein